MWRFVLSDWKLVRDDLFGGVTAAVVALPLAIAFGVSSGAGALAGLYGAIIAGFFATLFGGTRVQVTGPTGPMTVVMALMVTHFHADIAAAFSVVVLAGVLQIVFGKIGLGRYIKLAPQPVVSGFMSGIGFIIIIVQFAPLLGYDDPGGSVIQKLAATPAMLPEANSSALILGTLCLAIMFLIPRNAARIVPPTLVSLVVGTLLGIYLLPGAPVIGEIPSGLPDFIIPQFPLADLEFIIRFALILAFIGSIDSLLTSIVVDSMTRTNHDSNRELVGQGIGNITSGLMGGLPCAGATMRTLVNIRAGGHSRISGIVHSLILFVIVLGFGGIVSHIPLAVLAGILCKIGIDIVDWNYLKRIRTAPRAGVIIMFTTLVLTVFVDLMTAVAVGFVMASVLFVARMADAQIGSAKFAFGADQIDDLSEDEKEIFENSNERIVLFHIEGPLSFGSARDISRMMQSDLDKDVLIIDLRSVPFVDSSASSALMEVIERLHEINDRVILFGVRENVITTLRKIGVLQVLGQENIFDTRINALRSARKIIDGLKN